MPLYTAFREIIIWLLKFSWVSVSISFLNSCTLWTIKRQRELLSPNRSLRGQRVPVLSHSQIFLRVPLVLLHLIRHLKAWLLPLDQRQWGLSWRMILLHHPRWFVPLWYLLLQFIFFSKFCTSWCEIQHFQAKVSGTSSYNLSISDSKSTVLFKPLAKHVSKRTISQLSLIVSGFVITSVYICTSISLLVYTL